MGGTVVIGLSAVGGGGGTICCCGVGRVVSSTGCRCLSRSGGCGSGC